MAMKSALFQPLLAVEFSIADDLNYVELEFAVEQLFKFHAKLKNKRR
jgi:hypothetical protein